MINTVNQSAGYVRRLKNGKYQGVIRLGFGRGAKPTTKTYKTRREANAWVAKMKAEGVPTGDAAKHTVLQAVESYTEATVLRPNTAEVYTALRRHLVEQGIATVKLSALRPSHVAAFTAHLSRKGLAPSTVNLYAGSLNAVLRFAAADGALAFVPKTVTVRATTTKKTALTAEDVQALYEAAEPSFRPAIHLGAYAGLRAGEVCGVTAGDIDLKAGTITITKAVDDRGNYGPTKTPRSVRTIPVPSAVLALLPRWGGPDAPVVTLQNGGVMSTDAFSRSFRRTAKAAGLDDVMSHDLRKFFATSLLGAGKNPIVVAKILGDTVAVMLRTYALEQPADMDDARQVMADLFAATA